MGHGIYAVPNRLERNTAMQVDSAGDLAGSCLLPLRGNLLCGVEWSRGVRGALPPALACGHQYFEPHGGRGVSAGGTERAPRRARCGHQDFFPHGSTRA